MRNLARRLAAVERRPAAAAPPTTLYLWAPDGLRGPQLDAWAEERRAAAGADRVVVYRWAEMPTADEAC